MEVGPVTGPWSTAAATAGLFNSRSPIVARGASTPLSSEAAVSIDLQACGPKNPFDVIFLAPNDRLLHAEAVLCCSFDSRVIVMSVVNTVFRSARSTVLLALASVLVLVVGIVVGTNLVTAAPGTVTVSFNYNGATGGDSVTSAIVAPGASADVVLPSPTKSGFEFTGWFNNQSLLNGQRITTIGNSDSGVLTAGYVPPALAQTLKLLLPPPPPPPPPPAPSCANGGAPCVLGSIGPGGGLVFLIDGSTRYEMALKSWSGSGTPDASATWCDGYIDVPGAQGIAVGTGKANTAAMAASGACSSNAASAVLAYGGNDGSVGQWFLPSMDELNAMCNYSRNPVAPDAPSVPCSGSQNGTFAADLYGFAVDAGGFAGGTYWTSMQTDYINATRQRFYDGNTSSTDKVDSRRVRPIRSF